MSPSWVFLNQGRFKYQPGQVTAFGMLAGGSGITPMFQVIFLGRNVNCISNFAALTNGLPQV